MALLKNEQIDQIVSTSVNIVDRNRWFLISIILLMALVWTVSNNLFLSKRAAENIQIVYVKMMPDGTWDVDYHDDTRQVVYFKRTVDSILMSYALYRYSENPETINGYWAKAQYLMSEKEYKEFISENGFNAAKKAADIIGCENCSYFDVEVGDVVHIDYDQITSNNHSTKVYRSNIYYKEINKASDGTPLEDGVVERIASVHWRLKPLKEIESIAAENIKIIKKVNPIGIEIIKQDIVSPK